MFSYSHIVIKDFLCIMMRKTSVLLFYNKTALFASKYFAIEYYIRVVNIAIILDVINIINIYWAIRKVILILTLGGGILTFLKKKLGANLCNCKLFIATY